jgi:hypothetical protein
MYCNCSGPGGSKTFTLSGVTGTTACEPARSLCNPAVVPEPVGEQTCTVDYESAGSEYCERREVCKQEVAIDGAEANLTENPSGSCATDAATGATLCSCYNNSRSFRFTTEASAGDATTCQAALDLCKATEEPSSEGPIECELGAQSSSGDLCGATMECAQSATVAGVPVVLYGGMDVSCQPDGAGWACQCRSGVNDFSQPVSSASLTVTAAEAWDACSEAVEQCPALISVDFTSSGRSSPCGGAAGGASGIGVPCVF